MGKKRSRAKKTSKGLRPSINRSIINAVARGVEEVDKALHIMKAWKANKNPWVTVPNPATEMTNKRFIKVRANHLYGDPKKMKLLVP